VPGETAGSVKKAPATPRSTAFHGTADVTPTTAKIRLVQIADEIISILCSDPNAAVQVTLEVSAKFENGVSDQIKRTISENANSLGFKTKNWE
jgi:hypothetical protein